MLCVSLLLVMDVVCFVMLLIVVDRDRVLVDAYWLLLLVVCRCLMRVVCWLLLCCVLRVCRWLAADCCSLFLACCVLLAVVRCRCVLFVG